MSLSTRAEQLSRVKDIAWLALRYGRSDLVQAMDFEEAELIEETQQVPDDEKPEQLAKDLESMGPTFVKFGQMLSTRPDIISPRYLEALSRLQDDVAPIPFSEIEELVQEELGVRLSKAFRSFDPEPVAAASLAQVHRAVLRDGRLVAVKVQRPGIRQTILDDMELFEELTESVDHYTALGRQYGVHDLFESFRKTLLQELDFNREAQNLVRLADMLEEYDRIVVPRPVTDYTSSRVLTMEYVRGANIGDLNPVARLGVDGHRLAEELAEAYLDQLLVHGFFHADPHPGNILLTQDGRLALIDLGMVAYVTPHQQEMLMKLLLAITAGRGEEVVEIGLKMGQKLEHYDEAALRREISDLVVRFHDAQLREIKLGRIVMEMARISAEHGVRPAPELTMVGKMLLNLDEITRLLDPDFQPSRVVRRHSQQLMQQQLMRSLSPASLFSTILEVQGLLRQMPGQLNTLLEELVHHEFEIRVRAFDEARLMNNLQKIANRITMGLVLAALIVGAALLMQVDTPFRIWGYPGIAMVLFLLAATLGFILVLSIFIQDTLRR